MALALTVATDRSQIQLVGGHLTPDADLQAAL
jgi:hypothetical protein